MIREATTEGISLRSITKSFGATPVLKGVDLDIASGEFLTLLGPSGCGKSTLLRIIAGLDAQDGGAIAIDGRPIDGLRPKARNVSMVFQSYALYPHMTVAQNMALPLRMRQMRWTQRLPLIGRLMPGTSGVLKSIDHEVRRTAKALEIEHLLSRKPGQLSGGQRQRVAVGRAMVRHPAVFLMDEPLSNLDAKLRVQMRAEIKDLHRRLGVTFIYVTHDQAEAMTMSDRVAVMLDGELLQVAPPQEIYADPADRWVAEFVGSPKINILQGRVQEPGVVEAAGTRFLLNGSTVSATGTTVYLGIRPETLQLAQGPECGAIEGRVRMIEHFGSDLFVHIEVAGSSDLMVARLSTVHTQQIEDNHVIHVRVASEDVLVFDEQGQRVRPQHFDAMKLRSLA